MADARAGLDAFMHLMPGLSAEDKRLTRLRRPADCERSLDGLRKAGLPEK
jgi:hypothetical protein